jgi:DNA-binding MarR family transcriptional regulator
MYKLKFTLLQQEILRLLSMKAGFSFNARRLSQYLNVSQTAIAKSLPLLEKKQFITVEKDKESGRLAIELNRNNSKGIEFKRAENLRFVYESGLIEFLKHKFPDAIILLSGLYAKGEDIYSSDIDLAIIGSKKRTINLTKFDEILERKIKLIFYDSLKKIDNKLFEGSIGL